MQRRKRTVLAALLSCAVLGSVARAETLQDRVTAIEAETVKALAELAAWCHGRKLYETRDEILEDVLALDPDHGEARRRLRYEQDDDGAWIRPRKYRRPRNLARGADEAEIRLEDIRSDHRTKVLDLCTDAASIPDLQWAMRTTAAMAGRNPESKEIPLVERLLALRYYEAVREAGIVPELAETAAWLTERYPSDAAVRSALRETRRDDVWVLAETDRALSGAGALDRVVAEARKSVEVEPAPLPKASQAIELPWTEGVRTKHVRVYGTAPAEVLRDIATSVEITGPVFRRTLGTDPKRREDLAIYVFGAKEERGRFLDAYPVVENPTLSFRETLDLVYASGRTLAVRAAPPEAQRDLAVGEVLNQLISDTFLGHRPPRGWHAEGIARYLAWKITGTRLSISVSGTYGGQPHDREVPGSEDAWLASARSALAKQPDTNLQLVMGKGTDVFSPHDALVAYAFAVYLLEGFDGYAGRFVSEHAESKDVDATCRSVLGIPRTVTQHRMRRWLDEMVVDDAAK